MLSSMESLSVTPSLELGLRSAVISRVHVKLGFAGECLLSGSLGSKEP